MNRKEGRSCFECIVKTTSGEIHLSGDFYGDATFAAAKRRRFRSSYVNFSFSRKPQHENSITSQREISACSKYIKKIILLLSILKVFRTAFYLSLSCINIIFELQAIIPFLNRVILRPRFYSMYFVLLLRRLLRRQVSISRHFDIVSLTFQNVFRYYICGNRSMNRKVKYSIANNKVIHIKHRIASNIFIYIYDLR